MNTSPALLEQTMLSRATHLARCGHYDSALELITAHLHAFPQSLGALDLRARIFAQTGDWGGAETAWGKILEHQPEHTGARAGLERLRALRAKSSRSYALRGLVRLMAFGVVLGTLLLLAGWWFASRQAQDFEKLWGQFKARTDALDQNVTALSDDVHAVQGAWPALVEQRNRATEAIEERILTSFKQAEQGMRTSAESKFTGIEKVLTELRGDAVQKTKSLEAIGSSIGLIEKSQTENLEEIKIQKENLDSQLKKTVALAKKFAERSDEQKALINELSRTLERRLTELRRSISKSSKDCYWIPAASREIPKLSLEEFVDKGVFTFDLKLFDDDFQFTPEAQSLLVSFVAALRQPAHPITLKVIGHKALGESADASKQSSKKAEALVKFLTDCELEIQVYIEERASPAGAKLPPNDVSVEVYQVVG